MADEDRHGAGRASDEQTVGDEDDGERTGGDQIDGERTNRSGTGESHEGGNTNHSGDLRAVVDELSEAELRRLIRYATDRLESGNADTTAPESESSTEATAEASNTGAESPDGDSDSRTDPDAERPADVPTKATRVIKEINDNRYYYWQWRDGDAVKSKYDRPAGPE